MISDRDLQRITSVLPLLANASPELLRDFKSGAGLHTVPAGTCIFMEGDECGAIAILLSGVVRVFKVGETGREITLYRFAQGESCILTANCILGHTEFPAIAVVERDAEAVMIPATTFREWVARYEPWRDYVFNLLSRRLAMVMAIVDEVAFRRMDRRIADLLSRRLSPAQPQARLTHQEIAAELGTSREVVSRILQDFADSGLIATGRGTITLLDAERLAQRAASP